MEMFEAENRRRLNFCVEKVGIIIVIYRVIGEFYQPKERILVVQSLL